MMAPYGYRIENGIAVADEEKAAKIKELFRHYILGMSLKDAADKAGIRHCHATVSRIISNRKYTGDGYYPQIIDVDTFNRASEEKLKRAQRLGRIKESSKNEKTRVMKFRFRMNESKEFNSNTIHSNTINSDSINSNISITDSFKQAEYIYSQIECEVEIDECC